MPTSGELGRQRPSPDSTPSDDVSLSQRKSNETRQGAAGSQEVQAKDDTNVTSARSASAPASYTAVEHQSALPASRTSDQAANVGSPTATNRAQEVKDLFVLAARKQLDILQQRARVIELDKYARYASEDVDTLVDAVVTELQSLTSSSETFKEAALPFQSQTGKFRKALVRFRKGVRKAERAHKRLFDAEQDSQQFNESVANNKLPQRPGAADRSDERPSSPHGSTSRTGDKDSSVQERPDLIANWIDPDTFLHQNALSQGHELLDPFTRGDVAAGEVHVFTEHTAASDIEVEMSSKDPFRLPDSSYHHGDYINACGAQFDTGAIILTPDVKFRLSLQTNVGFVKLVYIGHSPHRKLLHLARTMNETSAISPYASERARQLVKDIQYQDFNAIFPRASIEALTSKGKNRIRGGGGNLHVQNWLNDPNSQNSLLDYIGDFDDVVHEGIALDSSFNLDVYHKPGAGATLNGSTTPTQYSGVADRFDQRPSKASLSVSPPTLQVPYSLLRTDQQPRYGSIITAQRDPSPQLRRHYSF